MKKVTLFALALGLYAANVQAQVNDTVSTGANYANQVWYSLETGDETSISADKWDIAFPTNSRSVAIRINDGGDVHLWKYPNGDQTAWSALDTTGLSTWDESYNSESDWDFGAFNDHASSAQFDYGWGEYDLSTHNLSANAVFVIQLADSSFRKIMIDKFNAVAGVYYFKYADLDGSNEVEDSLKLADYSGKNFAYYSLRDNKGMDLEPNKTDWDLLFTQYTAMIPAGPDTVHYVVTGVAGNINEGMAKVTGVDADAYTDYQSHPLDSAKNVIGYDWKSYDPASSAYKVADSTLFFIQDQSENIWKVVFTGFGGAADGNFIFSKEKLVTTAIHQVSGLTATMAAYPNPAVNGYFTVAYQVSGQTVPSVMLQVSDLSGRIVYSRELSAQKGMHQQTIHTGSWATGAYFLTLRAAGASTTQKIIVR